MEEVIYVPMDVDDESRPLSRFLLTLRDVNVAKYRHCRVWQILEFYNANHRIHQLIFKTSDGATSMFLISTASVICDSVVKFFFGVGANEDSRNSWCSC